MMLCKPLFWWMAFSGVCSVTPLLFCLETDQQDCKVRSHLGTGRSHYCSSWSVLLVLSWSVPPHPGSTNAQGVEANSALSLHSMLPEIGRLLSTSDKVYLHKVIKSLEQGMFEYILLDLMTNKACWKATRELPPPELSFVISNGKLQPPNASFNTSKESKLSFNNWCSAPQTIWLELCICTWGLAPTKIQEAPLLMPMLTVCITF